MKKHFIGLLLTSVALSGCGGQSSPKKERGTFTNPTSQIELLDPTIIRGDDGMFYGYFSTAQQDFGDGKGLRVCSSPIMKSSDLSSWTYAGQVFEDGDTSYRWDPVACRQLNLWSPEIVKIGNKYVYYYSLGMMSFSGDTHANGIGVCTADSPTGPFVNKGKLFDGNDVNNWDCIDPTVVVDGGKVYMFTGNFDGIFYVELSSDGLSVKKDSSGNIVPKYVAGFHSEDKKPWHQSGADNNGYSAPSLKKINGVWYMFLSTGAWNKGTVPSGTELTYHTICFQSRNITGPYKDSKGASALENNKGDLVSNSSDSLLLPGCGCVIEDDAENYYIAYQCFQNSLDGKRLLCIDELVTEDEYPHVKDFKPQNTVNKPVLTEN